MSARGRSSTARCTARPSTGISPPNAYTPVSQTGPTGTGTNADPFKIVTVADAGATGIRLTQTDTYTTGLESFRTDVVVSNTSGVVAHRARATAPPTATCRTPS